MQKYDQATALDQLLYGQFIKYVVLKDLVGMEFANSNAQEVNVFIDVYEMLLPLYKSINSKDSAEAISSAVINYASHFRAYFRQVHRVETNIIFVYSAVSSSMITRFCPEYNAKYRNRILSNDIMAEQVVMAIDRMKQIIPYLPNIFLKIGSVEPSVIIRDLILHEAMFQEMPNIVISTSQYAYQIPAYCPDTVVFRKIFNGKEVTACSYNLLSAIPVFIAETRKVAVENVIHPKLITALMVLSGIPKRNITSTKNIANTMELLVGIPQEAIGDINYLYDLIKERADQNKWKIMSREEFTNRYMAISIEYQGEIYRNLPESTESSFLIQINDPNGVQYVNNKYYAKHPLDLQRM